ncbi:MAG TPA: hypothetical protein VKQ34_00650 [Candidatus Saccharimonadales bacterium]|nr:hypothetical protein [Candidatus Saccharimonadales bacterium]
MSSGEAHNGLYEQEVTHNVTHLIVAIDPSQARHLLLVRDSQTGGWTLPEGVIGEHDDTITYDCSGSPGSGH